MLHDAAFFVHAEVAVALVAGFQELFAGKGAKVVEVFEQRVAEGICRLFRIVVGSAEWFGNDFVDDAEFFEVIGVDFERLGGLGRGGAVFPKDSGAAFGRDDGVITVFENEHAVGDADAEGSAGTAFADDDCDRGNAEHGHFAEVDGDGFGDVAFFGFNARKGSGCVDERDHGQAEFFGEAHQAKGFSITFGLGHTEVALDIFLGVAAFLLGDDHDGLALEKCGATDECAVVVVLAVAVEFLKIFEEKFDVIEGVGAFRMAGDLNLLPRGKTGINFALGRGDFALDADDFLGEIEFVFLGTLAQLFELRAQFAQWLFKFERVDRLFHRRAQ